MTERPEHSNEKDSKAIGDTEFANDENDGSVDPVSPEEIDEAIGDADWEELPDSTRRTLSRVRMEKYSYRAPVPPPEMLCEFENIVPGSARQIMDDAHAQMEHRHETERKEITSVIGHEKRGQIFAFIITMTIMVGGLGLLFTDRSVAGFALLIPGLASLAGVFIYSEWQQRQDLRERLESQSQGEQEHQDSA